MSNVTPIKPGKPKRAKPDRVELLARVNFIREQVRLLRLADEWGIQNGTDPEDFSYTLERLQEETSTLATALHDVLPITSDETDEA